MIAACGTGMGALALLFREIGVSVSGSDEQAYPPMGDLLRKAGVHLSLGYRPENLPQDVDFVVVGNAVSKDNPEVEAMLARGLPYGSFPESLAHFFLASRCPIVVTGTHGKTTSTALLAWLLECAGAEPGFLVGGEPINFGSSSRLGRGKYFVIEGDEYDSAFFDKGPKFLHYRPAVALMTSLEFDHADIYPDLVSIREQFVRFAALLPSEGLLLVCNEYPEAVEIARMARCKVETYGYGKGADWSGSLVGGPGACGALEVSCLGRPMGTFPLPLSGRHNGLNVLGSLHDYAEAFCTADVAICAPVYRPESIAPAERFSPGLWVEELRRRGRAACCFDESWDLEQALKETCRPGDVVVFMSSGSFSGLLEKLKATLGKTG